MTVFDSSFPPTPASTSAPGPAPTYYRVSWRTRLASALTATRTVAGGVPRLVLHSAARGVALFFGVFGLLNLLGELRAPGFDQNIWWLDLRPLSASASAAVLGAAGVLLVWWALRPAAQVWRSLLTAGVLVTLAIVAVKNGVTFYNVWRDGLIDPWLGVPLSFVLAAVLVLLAGAVASAAPLRRPRRAPSLAFLVAAAALLLCGLLFPLAQQAFFGKTTYVRHADVAVVFGAQVHPTGHASITLADRVATAADLYRRGLADRLLMSGAQGGDEPVNEVRVMRELAVEQGVPASAISVDPKGVNTDATVGNTITMLRSGDAGSVAVVSDFFHLPRIKLAYQRAGVDVITVPSHARRIPQTTGLVIREIPAFWVYYLRAVL
jgi:vancomycin permeability regulator SanA